MSTSEDMNLVLLLAGGGGCSLDSSPGKNWVENSGGLPDYICRIAKSISKGGKSKSAAIAIAVSRVKAWASGGDDVEADTRAKAAKAVAEWEALKKKNKARQVVKASRIDGTEYLMLSNTPESFNTDIVRTAWNQAVSDARSFARAQAKAMNQEFDYESVPYSYIRELWSDHIIVEVENNRSNFLKVPYTVSGNSVSFGDPTAVKVAYVPVESSVALSANEKELLGQLIIPTTPAERIRELLKK